MGSDWELERSAGLVVRWRERENRGKEWCEARGEKYGKKERERGSSVVWCSERKRCVVRGGKLVGEEEKEEK